MKSDQNQRPASQTGGAPVLALGGVELTKDELIRLGKSINQYMARGTEDQPLPGEMHPVETTSTVSAVIEAKLEAVQADSAQTPEPDESWQATGELSRRSGIPADAQIAVSRTHVVVTIRAVVAFYDKNGLPLQPPIPLADFFQDLNLQPTLGINLFFDARAVFDSYRRRFWIAALAFNTDDDAVRRKFVIGVSQSENPLDGWHLYWWDAVADPVFQAGDKADYPSIGIDARCFYQTNIVENGNTGRRYWRVLIKDADQMAGGAAGPDLSGWQYWDLANPDGSPARLMQPVLHHGKTPHAYLASRFSDDKLLIWTLTDPLESTRSIERVEVSVSPFGDPQIAPQADSAKPIETRNLSTNVLKCVYRDGFLYLTMNDARDWDSRGETLTSIRLVRLNVSDYPAIPVSKSSGFIDRVFGARNGTEDPAGHYFHYAWSAVEVNRYGHMAVVYARSGPTIYPEARFSVYYANEPDIRSSRVLKLGDDPYEITFAGYNPQAWPWGDTAGASVDPSDDTTIWIAQQYAAARGPDTSRNGNFEVWVGKITP